MRKPEADALLTGRCTRCDKSMESAETMNATQASETLFDPQRDLAPRQVGLKQLLLVAPWLPPLAAIVSLSFHRLFTSKRDSFPLKFVAFVSFFVILFRVGTQSDIWESQP